LHPKKPPQSIIDDLKIPYHQQVKEKLEALKPSPSIMREEGKKEFQKNFRCPATFSERDFFNTVFISGDDMVKEQLDQLHKEQDDWKKKVVVANTHFQVNTRVPKRSEQTDKHNNMLEEEPKKIGLRLSQKRIREQTARQIFVSKNVGNMPSTIFAEG